MTLSQSALSELLDAIRAGGGIDLAREAYRLVAQELIELEATHGHRRRPLRADRRAHDPPQRLPQPRCCRPRRATSSCTSRSSGRAASSRPCSSPGGASTGRSGRWSWRPTSTACPTRKVDDLVAALGIEAGVSKSEVSRICAELDGDGGRLPGAAPRPCPLPLPVPRRHLRQGAPGPVGRVQGHRGRDRGDRARRAGGARPRGRRHRGRRLLDGVPALAPGARPRLACASSSAMPTRGSRAPSRRCSWARPGSAAGCTSCATCSRASRRAPPRWCSRPSARSSPSPTRRRSGSSSTRSWTS